MGLGDLGSDLVGLAAVGAAVRAEPGAAACVAAAAAESFAHGAGLVVVAAVGVAVGVD